MTAMNPVLSQYTSRGLYSSNPLALHLAALDYDANKGTLYSDYVSALQAAHDLGIGLIASHNAVDAQAISLLSTALSSILPTAHIYDGLSGVRTSNKVSNWLSTKDISETYSILTSSYDLHGGSISNVITSLLMP